MAHSRTNPNPFTSSDVSLFNTAMARPGNRFSHFLFHELNYQDAVSLDLLLNHIAPGLTIAEKNGIYGAFEQLLADMVDDHRNAADLANDALIDAQHEIANLEESKAAEIERLALKHNHEITELKKKLHDAHAIAGKFAIQLSSFGFANLADAAAGATKATRKFGRAVRWFNRWDRARSYFARIEFSLRRLWPF